MELPKKVVETVNAEIIGVFCKVCDSGNYVLKGAADHVIAERDDYVPSFFPGDHHGDYIDFQINLETGQILNWKKPEPIEVSRAFNLIESEE